MGDRRDDAPRFHPQTADEWWAWLAVHHGVEPPGVWVVQWRRAGGQVPVDYENLVDAALAHGWIDGTNRGIDDDRMEMWFTRRRQGSRWSRLSKQRVARVEASGRMTAAGRAVIERAKADGSWTLLDGPEAGIVPDDLAEALAAHPGARELFGGLSYSRRVMVLAWIAEAKRPETRAARVAKAAEHAARGETPVG